MRNFLLMLIAYFGVVIATPFVVLYKTLFGKMPVSEYFITVAIGFDQAGGSVLYEEEDYTISSYTYMMCQKGKYCWFMRLIEFLFGKGHCKRSYINEQNKLKQEANNG